MNEKLPRPMLEALAREAKPQEHPSADALAAFAEQAVTERKKDSVVEHLAQCAECREVVFLASSAAEEVTEPAGELAATTFRREHLRAVAARAGGEMPRAAMVSKPRRSWTARGLWATSAAAVLVLVGGLFVWRGSLAAPRAREMALKSEPEVRNINPAEVETEKASQSATPSTAPEAPNAKARQAPPAPVKGRNNASQKVEVTAAAELPPPRPIAPHATNVPGAGAASAKVIAESGNAAIGGAVPGPVPSSPRAYGFAPNAGQGQEQVDSVNVAVSRALTLGARTQHPNWRISSEGHLEHLGSNGWVRELANEPSAFRVVAVVSSDVWAGGDKGTFFHSADNGQHWNKVALAGESSADTGAIVSIRFNDAQNGEVSTDRGANYVTSDGGTTWTKRQ